MAKPVYYAYQTVKAGLVKQVQKIVGYLSLIFFLDCDGVFIRKDGDLDISKDVLKALAVLLLSTHKVFFLTGRYLKLLMEKGIPEFINAGIEIKNFLFAGEMGGVIVTAAPAEDGDDSLSKEAKLVGCPKVPGIK